MESRTTTIYLMDWIKGLIGWRYQFVKGRITTCFRWGWEVSSKVNFQHSQAKQIIQCFISLSLLSSFSLHLSLHDVTIITLHGFPFYFLFSLWYLFFYLFVQTYQVGYSQLCSDSLAFVLSCYFLSRYWLSWLFTASCLNLLSALLSPLWLFCLSGTCSYIHLISICLVSVKVSKSLLLICCLSLIINRVFAVKTSSFVKCSVCHSQHLTVEQCLWWCFK